jgi:hypothetical protein
MTEVPHMQCLLEVVAAADLHMADLADQQGVAPPVLHSLVQGSVVTSVGGPLLVEMYPYDLDTEPPSPVDMVADAALSSAGGPSWAIAPSTCGRSRNLSTEELHALRREEQLARVCEVRWQDRGPPELVGH